MSAVVPFPRRVVALGIDPGPSTGIALIRLGEPAAAQVFQCNAAAAPWLLARLLEEQKRFQVTGGIEAFAPGRGAGAARHGSRVSRQVEELAGICAESGVPLQARFASVVKAWATDKRLREAGLYELTAGGTHCRDAARHALFCAVYDGGLPDPLSKARG